MNYQKYFQDLLNYQFVLGTFEELDHLLFIAA